ncbi:DUF3866 family protein [Paenibacillus sp. GYB003]|uniref:DUF3866 family protein n=1 Tax=Paenibacillus sp. GYB003 TaxID=2994392 RepID=UPI002F96B949
MIIWTKGTVVGIVEEGEAVQRIELMEEDGGKRAAIHYTDERPRLRVGDRVTVNVTADRLGLGGAQSIVHDVWRAEGDDGLGVSGGIRRASPGRPGHIVKLRFTPEQRAVLAVEEEASPHHASFAQPGTLQGMPVLIGELHSMLPIAAAWIRGENPASRVTYIMTDGGALPLAFSKHAAELRSGGWLTGTVTYGHAYGGDLEAVNKYTALLAARHVQRAHIAIAVMGPGIVGTGTPLGHTATEMAELVHAVHALAGVPIVIPRISFADRRERHRGVSHHLLETMGKLTLACAIIPLPDGLGDENERLVREQLASSGCADRHEIVRVAGVTQAEAELRLSAYPLPVTTMGRGLRDDPAYYTAVCAAAHFASSRVPDFE